MTDIEILSKLAKGNATVKELRVPIVKIYALEADGLVEEKDTVKTGKRGRPALIWGLTRKGREKVRRAAKRSVAAAA